MQGPRISPRLSERVPTRRSVFRSDSRGVDEEFGETAVGSGRAMFTHRTETDDIGWFAEPTGMMAIVEPDWSGSTIDQG